MLQELNNRVEGLALIVSIAGLPALIAALYRFALTREQHSRNHNYLVLTVHKISGMSWLVRVQDSMTYVNNILDRLYGPVENRLLISHVNERAWKTSALIVGSYLLIFPNVALILLAYFSVATDASKDQLHIILYITSYALVLALGFYFGIRGLKSRLARTDKVRMHDFAGALAIRGVIFSIILSALLTLIWYLHEQGFFINQSAGEQQGSSTTQESIVGGLIAVLLFGAFFVYFVYSFFSAIAKYGLRSPIYLGLLVVFCILFTVILLNTVFAIFLFFVFPIVLWREEVPIVEILRVFIIICLALPSLASFYCVFKKRKSYVAALTLCTVSSAGILATYSIFLSGWGNYHHLKYTFEVLLIVISVTAIFILYFYTPIIANSIPDLLSVAFTRYCIYKASVSLNTQRLIFFLAIDLIVAMVCVCLSIAIFAAGAYAVVLLSSYLEVRETFSQTAFLAVSFVGYHFWDGIYFIYLLLYEIVQFSSLENLVERLDSLGSTAFVVAFLLLGFSMTGALPTLVNAVALSYGLLSKTLITLAGGGAIRLHGLLTEVDDNGVAIGQWRSVALISIAASGCIILAVILTG